MNMQHLHEESFNMGDSKADKQMKAQGVFLDKKTQDHEKVKFLNL